MKCTNCGAVFESGTLFCPRCGKEIQWVPEYHSLETWMRQKELQEQEKKKRELEIQKERERAERKAEQERQRKRKKRLTVAGVAAAALAVLGIGGFLVYRTQYNSFDFQMAQAETKFSNKAYEEAFQYVERALAIKPESAEANILEAKIYLKEDNEAAALSILVSVAEANPDSTSAYGELLRLYEKQGAFDKIRNLMASASEDMKTAYQDYVCEMPQVSAEGGTYKDEKEIFFRNLPEGTEVYYTTDGTVPDKNSEPYDDGILFTEEGTTTLKYIAYNKKGIPSEAGEQVYKLIYEPPHTPNIAPSSGKYNYLEHIIVTAQEGCDIYYAFDAEPTVESEKYTEPIPMPTGEHTFSAIAVDARGKISRVNSAIYVYYGE